MQPFNATMETQLWIDKNKLNHAYFSLLINNHKITATCEFGKQMLVPAKYYTYEYRG